MTKRANITESMRTAAGSSRAMPDGASETTGPRSRTGSKAITGHFPPQVRYQLKLLAAEQDRTMEDMLAEGLNLLFGAYHKPEVAPTRQKDSD